MLAAALRAIHALLGAALARIVQRRIAARGVPITPEQQRQLARQLHREVVQRRERSYRAAVSDAGFGYYPLAFSTTATYRGNPAP